MTGPTNAVKLPTRSTPWLYVFILATIAFMAWHYVPFLVNATLSRYDEFYTLDRTSSVLSHGDVLTIYANHVPSFNKPPLQYWLGAAFLKFGMPVDIALRAMPFIWALGTLALTGVLAAMLAPASAVAVIGAILFLSSSTLFWGSATSAMLDSGAGFFTVAAAVTFLAALCASKAVLVGGRRRWSWRASESARRSDLHPGRMVYAQLVQPAKPDADPLEALYTDQTTLYGPHLGSYPGVAGVSVSASWADRVSRRNRARNEGAVRSCAA